MSSQKQIEANRENAKSSGVKTAKGKAVSRYNALKHGVLRQSLTAYEKEICLDFYQQLVGELKPVGFLESLLVERIGLYYVRLFRSAKAEQEQILSELDPTITKELFPPFVDVVRKGYQPKLRAEKIDEVSRTILRYERSAENGFYRTLHELGGLQKNRNLATQADR
ncbi:hypothetical protein ACFLZP_03970 [Patescibacteria group bacterium]